MGLTKPRATQIYDIDYKQATRVITITNVSLSGGAPSTVDGVSLSTGDRVLVTGQSTVSQNGLYYVATLGSGSNGTWARTSDTNETGELEAGTIVMVTEGTIYHDTQWKLTTNNPIVIGTSDLVFEQNSAFAFGNVYANSTAVLATTVGDVLTLTAGNNISITGNASAKSVKIDVTQVISVTGNITGANLSLTGNVLGNLSVTGNVASTYFLGNANVQYTASSTPPTGNLIGAQWYNTSNDVLYEWQTDGTSTYWVDVAGPTFGTNGAVTGSSITNGTSNVKVALSGNGTVNIGGTPNVVVWSSAGEYVNGFINVNGNVYTPRVLNGFSGLTIDSGYPGYIQFFNGAGSTVLIGDDGNISAVGNVTGSNLISTGAVYSNYNTNTANIGSFMATGGNTKGGTGYLDFLVVQNTSGGATNPYKWLRINPTGVLELVNSAYTSTIFSMSDGGNLSITGQYQVAGKQAVNGPAFRAYIDGSQAITSGSQQKVTFGSETFDTNSNFSSSRFTPTVEGYYQLNATIRIEGNSGTGEVMITIWKNGSEYARGTNEGGTEQGANWYSMQVSDIAYANGSSDYFEIYIQQTSGGNRNTTAGQNISYFSGAMVRGA